MLYFSVTMISQTEFKCTQTHTLVKREKIKWWRKISTRSYFYWLPVHPILFLCECCAAYSIWDAIISFSLSFFPHVFHPSQSTHLHTLFFFLSQSEETANMMYFCDWQGKSHDEKSYGGWLRAAKPKPARFDFPCDVESMRIIKFIIKRSQKPLVLMAMKFSSLSLNTFSRVSTIMSVSWSLPFSVCLLFFCCIIRIYVFMFTFFHKKKRKNFVSFVPKSFRPPGW